MIDDRTERLITRKLDGELTEEESLELNKLLIRTPEARTMLEDYTRMDARAAEVIHDVVSAPVVSELPANVAAGTQAAGGTELRHRRQWYSLAAISAVAAVITLTVLLSQRTAGIPVPHAPGMTVAAPDTVAVTSAPPGQFQWASTLDEPRRQTDSMETEVFGVWDRESRSLYLLEADTAGSLVEPVKYNY
jgi:anti-sigma factor RsiW